MIGGLTEKLGEKVFGAIQEARVNNPFHKKLIIITPRSKYDGPN